MRGCTFWSSFKCFIMKFPTCKACSCSPSCSITSRTAWATSHETGLPPNCMKKVTLYKKVPKFISYSDRANFHFFIGGVEGFWVGCNTPFLMLWSGMKCWHEMWHEKRHVNENSFKLFTKGFKALYQIFLQCLVLEFQSVYRQDKV